MVWLMKDDSAFKTYESERFCHKLPKTGELKLASP